MTMPAGLSQNAYLPNHVKLELDLALPIAQGAPKKLGKAVQERLCLAGFPVTIDSDFGPATAQQLKNFQQKNGLPPNGTYAQKEHDLLSAPFVKALNPLPANGRSLGDTIVAVARQHIAQHPLEVGGDNCGPWVRIYMEGRDGEEWKWCAGFSFFAVDQACALLGQEAPMDTTYTVDTIVERAKSAGKFYPEQKAKPASGKGKIAPGSLFVVRATATHWSHTGIVSHADADSYGTCEGNTNDDGSSNGYEAIERVRGYKGKDFVVW